MKKLLALVLSVLMAASLLAGCGSSSDTTAADNTTKAESSAPADQTGKTQEAVTIKYMTWTYADRTKSTDAWIKDMKDKFNITIDMQAVVPEQYETTFKTKLVANDLPDLTGIHSITKDMSAYKAKIDPNLFIDISGLPAVADYRPEVAESRKINGKLYYMPISTNVLGAIYNKKVFADNGINVPKNIDEFTAACEKLKAAKIAPIAGGFKDAWTTQIIPFIAFGQYINAKDANTAVKLGDGSLKYADIKDDMAKVLNVQQDWAAKGYFPDNFLGSDVNVAGQLVATGKAGMLINGTWQYTAVQGSDPNAQIGWFLVPLNAAGEKVAASTISDEGIAIPSASKNLEAAKTALNYYLGAENQVRVITDLNGVSTSTKVKVDNAFLKDVSDSLTDATILPDWWGVGTNNKYSPGNSSFAIDKQLQNLLAKGTTVDKFLADFDSANAKALGK